LYLDGLLIDSRRHANPELVKILSAERQRKLDDQWRLITRKYLVNYNPEERDRYLAEENRIAEWHRDYRSKYELEQAMLRWREQQARLLIVGTRAHTRCLYLYIPEFPQLDVQAFVPLDDLPGEQGEFDVYPELELGAVPWAEIDAVLISTHEYQTLAMERVQRHTPPDKPIIVIYDDSGDSLLYVLPDKWPVMNPLEAELQSLMIARSKSEALGGVDLDFQPEKIKIQERYAVIINYHYCHPAEGAEFKGMKGMRPEDLDQQLRLLTRNFTLATIGQLLNPRAALPETVAVLTFDDGLKDVVKYALPVLKRWGVPATIFCCSAPLIEGRLLDVHKIHILQGKLGVEAFRKEFERVLASHNQTYELDSPERLGIRNLYRYDDEATRGFKMLLNYQLPYPVLTRALSHLIEEIFGAEAEVAAQLYLSPAEIQSCQKAGLEIGLHSHQHYILSRLEETEQRRELETAAAYFKDNFGVEHLHLAYPYGGVGTWNSTTKRLLEELNFESGMTMARRIVKPSDLSHRWEIPRFDVRDVFESDNSLRADKLRALFSSD
jgi:peptidoglycan/xylan/chitin deacetylase (PgdA/CDA1 family)